MVLLKRLWIAGKVPSLTKVILPLFVGFSMAFYSQPDKLNLIIFLGLLLYAWFLQLFIIFFNDVADEKADTLQKTQFPNLSSHRVIPDGLFTKNQLFTAGWVMVGLLLILCILLTIFHSLYFALPILIGSLLLLYFYSFPPVQLNYRGFGELLETLGVGLVLPLTGFYFYSGALQEFNFAWILPVIITSLASALCSGIKDKPADALSGKKTITILFGTGIAKLGAMISLGISILYCLILGVIGAYSLLVVVFSVLIAALFFIRALQVYKQADHTDIPRLRIFKKNIHRAIYSTNLGLIFHFFLISLLPSYFL